MSTDTQIAALTDAVNQLLAAATTKVSDLNAAVTNAQTFSTDSANSATASAASAANSLTYSQNAANTLTEFQKWDLGALAADPTGTGYYVGASYWNTTTGERRTWTGSNWQVNYTPSPSTTSNINYTGTLTGGTGVVNIGSGQFYKDGQGNVALGNTAPRAKMDVGGDAYLGGDVKGYAGLAAIAASKTDAAVAVFVYDTSKDSDGGAWRKRCQGTSWYNEALNTATRGARRDFPAVAVIVATATSVIIYDGDDPALPMWMVFSIANYPASAAWAYSSVTALNGKILVGLYGTYGGLLVLEVIADAVTMHRTSATKSYAWNNVAPLVRTSALSINDGNATPLGNVQAQEIVNSVAMTVLPSAPVDPATGLPVPTIAVATYGGVSVIKDDGTVVNNTNNLYGILRVSSLSFDAAGNLLVQGQPDTIRLGFMKSTDYTSYAFGTADLAVEYNALVYPGIPFKYGSNVANIIPDAVASGKGAAKLFTNWADANKSMVHALTSTWLSGWMPGNIKGAWLADTDATSLVAAELVTNGTFDTDLTGWSDPNGIASVSGGVVTLTSASGNPNIYQAITGLTVGRAYKFSYTATGNYAAYVSTNNVSSGDLLQGKDTFIATASTLYVVLYVIGTGHTCTYDNVSLKPADADRSVNRNGLIVNGTITRAPVATGAELVGYSGFSAANYLEQPYNSALDFGAGDFSAMGWHNSAAINSTARNQTILSRDDGTNGWYLWSQYLSGFAEFYTRPTGSLVGTTNIGDGGWHHVAAIRRAGVKELWVDGRLEAQQACTDNVSSATATLVAGVHLPVDPASYTQGGLALLRVSATAPTADQIAKIYRDELPLFQPGAQGTLYGSSDAVTALAYDEDTDLLHVGTSAGRSVFDGLVRIANTTTPVATAISAVDGLVVES